MSTSISSTLSVFLVTCALSICLSTFFEVFPRLPVHLYVVFHVQLIFKEKMSRTMETQLYTSVFDGESCGGCRSFCVYVQMWYNVWKVIVDIWISRVIQVSTWRKHREGDKYTINMIRRHFLWNMSTLSLLKWSNSRYLEFSRISD